MKEFTVRLEATDYCGFWEEYKVQALNEDDAEDVVMEKYLEEFVDLMSLTPVDNGDGGYVEMCDLEEWEDDHDSVETTTISAKTL